MAGNIVGLHVFGPDTGPEPLSNLDNNFTPIAAAINNLNTFSNPLVDTGAADAAVVTIGANQSATLSFGLLIQVQIAATNLTSTPQLNFNGTGNKTITDFGGQALLPKQLFIGNTYTFVYDGTTWRCQSINNIPGANLTPLTLHVSKAADTARNTTIVQANDPDLVIAIPYQSRWLIQLGFLAHSPGSGGIRWNLNYSGTLNGSFGAWVQGFVGSTNIVSPGTSQAIAGSQTTAMYSSAGPLLSSSTVTDGATVFAMLYAASAGNLGFAWAQNTSNASNLTIALGSYMTATALS